MKKLICVLLFLSTYMVVTAQNVGINSTGATPHSSAMLDVSSTSSGMLVPRMTAAQRTSIATPATGLLVFQSDAPAGFYFYTGSGWTRISAGIDASGTSNYVAKFNGTSSLVNSILYDNGTSVGIGTSFPSYTLHVNGSAAANEIRANIFYDLGNSSYYLDPASVSILSDVRASIFYDRDNTTFYVDPASTTYVNALTTAGLVRHNSLSGSGTRIVVADLNGILTATTSASFGLVSGTGTPNYLTKWASASTQGSSVMYDNGTNIGIGTTTPTFNLHINGTAAANVIYDNNNSSYYLDPASISLTNDMRANIFYDAGNTSFYLDPASTSITNDMRANVFYDYGNTSFFVDPASASILNDVRASIYYDRDNTSFYVDPANISYMAALYTTSNMRFGILAGSGSRIVMADATGVLSAYSAAAAGLVSGVGTTNYIPKWTPSGNVLGNSLLYDSGFGVGIGTATPNYLLHVNGTLAASIFYDNNNTSYYLDPASTSITNDMRANIYYDLGNTGYYVDPASISITNDMRANIFYDFGNTNYYVDPAINAVLYNLRIGTDVTTLSNQGVFWHSGTDYAIYRETGAWSSPYPDLRIAFHTGIKIGANYAYNGVRFYNNSDMATQIFSVGDGDNNVRAYYGMYSPILYDLNNTSYYIDPASTSYTNDLRANILYDLGNTSYYVDPASTSITNDFRANIFYDASNTSYYLDPASISNLGSVYTVGTMRFSSLAGSGTRVVVADLNGVLSATTAVGAGLVSGTGSTNYVTKWTSASTQGNSVMYDNGTNMGIGTTGPSYKLHVVGDIYANGGWLRTSGAAGWYNESYGSGIYATTSGEVATYNGAYFRITGAGNSSGNLRFDAANPYIVSTSYFVAPGGAYFNSGTVYTEAQYQCRGGIHNDNAGDLTIAGGTNGTTYFSGPISGMSGALPPNNMVRLTPNLHLNAASGYAVIANWDNGTTGTSQALRVGNGAGSDAFYVRADSYTWAATTSTSLSNVIYASRPSGNYGGGRATIYGYRYGGTSGADGSGYGVSGIDAGVQGYTFYGNLYAFGVAGHSYGDYTRTGGTLGSNNGGSIWGSLGYKNSGGTWYGLYYTSTGNGAGFMNNDGIVSGIGSGGYGGVMGGWSRGEVLGFTAAGELYASYNIGNEYTSGVSADIVTVEDERIPAYSVTSNEIKVYSDGVANLSSGYCRVEFDRNFASLVTDGKRPTVTVSPMGECEGIFIVSIDNNGFVVKESRGGQSNVEFTWIAVGLRTDANSVGKVPDAITDKNFDQNMKDVMFNENNTDQSAKPIWWDGNSLRFDKMPETNVKKTDFDPNAQQKQSAEEVNRLIEVSSKIKPENAEWRSTPEEPVRIQKSE